MFKIIKLGVKVGIVYGAYYVTAESGVWKDSKTTSQLYNDIRKTLTDLSTPYIEQIPISLPEMPQTGSWASNYQTTWNNVVLTSALALTKAPDALCRYTKDGYNFVAEAIKNLDH